jgi:hypothetical protein
MNYLQYKQIQEYLVNQKLVCFRENNPTASFRHFHELWRRVVAEVLRIGQVKEVPQLLLSFAGWAVT